MALSLRPVAMTAYETSIGHDWGTVGGGVLQYERSPFSPVMKHFVARLSAPGISGLLM